MSESSKRLLWALMILAGLAASPACAQEGQSSHPPETVFFKRDTLTGTWGGLRTDLENRGITL